MAQLRRLSVSKRIVAWRLSEYRPVTADKLIDALYGDDPDGGPDDAMNNVKVSLAGCAVTSRRSPSPSVAVSGARKVDQIRALRTAQAEERERRAAEAQSA